MKNKTNRYVYMRFFWRRRRSSRLKPSAHNQRIKEVVCNMVATSRDPPEASSKETTENPDKMLPIRMTSRVVRGFGRGSSDLGIPTANLDLSVLNMHRLVPPSSSADGGDSQETTTEALSSLQDIPCGIYWGFCRVGERRQSGEQAASSPLGVVYKAAISIGFNPTYGNDSKTVEPHLIAPEDDPRRHASSSGETILQDFYDQPIRLSVVGYLRPELPFEGLDKLVVAIKKDIADTVHLADSDTSSMEKSWVDSE